jgi:hypothetical protein
MVTPVSQFVRNRKSIASVGTAGIDCDDGLVAVAYDPRFAPVERLSADPRAHMVRDGLKVDFPRLRNAELLEKTFGRADLRHG